VSEDQIRLVLPARAAYGRIARVAASGLGLRLGLDYAAVEDLRIAVDEVMILLLAPADDQGRVRHDGELALTFTVGPDRLVIDAGDAAPGRAAPLDHGARARFDEIIADTVDVVEVDEATATVHLEKAFHDA